MKKIALLFVVAFVVYAFSFGNEFLWDDEQFIVKNLYVHDLSTWPNYFSTSTTAGAGIVSNYYRPLTTFSFAVDYAIWGEHPFGFHLTNTLLHALAGVLVYAFLKKMLKIYSADDRFDLLAYLTAFAFVLHPAQVEAVVYINSRGDSLSIVYGLASILCLMKISSEKSENKRILWGIAAFLSFFIALLTKETAIVWVGVSALYLAALAHHQIKIRPGIFLTTILEAVTAGIYFSLRFTVLQFQSTSDIWGASGAYANSIVIRMGTFLTQAVPQYVFILLWPTRLHMERDVQILKSVQLIPIQWLAMLIGLAAGSLAYSVYILKKKERFPHPFMLGLALLIFFIAPFSGVIPLNGILYEHWLYAPMIGWWLIILYFLQKYLPDKLFLSLCVVIFSIWGILSIEQVLVWRSPFTLYPSILQYTESARVHINLGMEYANRNDLDHAIPEYNKGLALTDRYPQVHHNLGNAYLKLGENEKAESEYIKALEIDPTFTFSLSALIQLEIALKNKEAAQKWAAYAVEKLPGDLTFQALFQRVQTTQW